MIAFLKRPSVRLKVGGIALALAAGVVLGNSAEEGNVATPQSPALAMPPASDTRAAPASSALDLDKLRRAALTQGDVTNVFAGTSWVPKPAPTPPPAAPVNVPAPAPVAPPLPFVYVGQFHEDGQATVYYLERGVQVLTVAAGQDIDASYRLEGLSNGALEFIFLPLNTRQSLRIGE